MQKGNIKISAQKKKKKMKEDSPTSSSSLRFKKKSLFDKTSFLGRVCFSYIFPTFLRGAKNNGLDAEDIRQCPVDDEAEKLLAKVSRYWQTELRKRKPRFWRALLKAFIGQTIFPISILVFIECFLNIVQPFLLGRVILFFSGDVHINYKEACIYAAGICLTSIINITLVHPTFTHMARVGMRVRVACATMMYQKSLKLSRAALNDTSVGTIINILGNDCMRFDEFGFFSTYLVTGPLQTAIVVYFLWSYLGVACFSGLLILVLFIPFQSVMGKLFSKIRLGTAILTDTRLRYMHEIISGIRVIKMYNWQQPFADRVAAARKAEISQIRKACFLKGLNLSIFFVASRLILFVCFVVFVLLGNVLTAEAVFVTMSLLNTLRLTMTLFYPQAIGFGAELKITCGRIQGFLMLEEMSIDSKLLKEVTNGKKINAEENGNAKTKNPEVETGSVVVDNITASWTKDQNRKTLQNISVTLEPGDLLAVVGSVGSGKSSFLMSLLKELPLESGSIDLHGSVSYASQDAWSFNDSVRQNILFGAEYNAKEYSEVLACCALQRDLQLMPFGDRTLVGEKGVSLSGGQRARINLARAVYRDPQIILLDDPLSAVDPSVAEHIFEECILKRLKEKKKAITILATHQIQFIEKATAILVLKEGECLALGSYAELTAAGLDFMSLIDDEQLDEAALKRQESLDGSSHHLGRSRSSMMSVEEAGKASSMTSLREKVIGRSVSRLESIGGTKSHTSKLDLQTTEEDAETEALLQTVGEEAVKRGSISGRIYLEYIKAGAGPLLLISMIIASVISQSIFNGVDIFITEWTNKNQQLDIVDTAEQQWDITIYGILIATLFVSTILRSVSFFAICMRASVRLHNNIFERLVRAPVSFFENSPAGRVLNRFTKDLGIIDDNLPSVAYDLNLIGAQAIGIIVTVGYVNWYLVFPAALLSGLVLLVRFIYIKSARDIKRYEGLARSPVYSHVATTINGLASIRAYGAQRTFQRQFYLFQNDHTATWFLFISSSRAIGLVIDWICILFNIVIVLAVMLSDQLPGGNAGLAITSGLLLAGMSQWGVRQSCEFESQMTSVERLVEYQELEQEAAARSVKGREPPPDWPATGQIIFNHMSLSYGAEPVLKDINATIEGGEKVGIVGRTGAGKSSLISALFRLTEPSGTIRIDGINISSIGLEDLRKRLSIIPQDPVVFTGTVRYNLDPFGEYPDDQLWAALEKVQLKGPVENLTGRLDAKLADGGANLSVGQRQLICLARAILRRSPILILDEATANTDFQTDTLIQQTIRDQFASNTVLTIAHRIVTVIDSSRLLVLDAGRILEFDSPYVLLKSKGAFYEMCKKTGPTMFKHLYQLARKAYNLQTSIGKGVGSVVEQHLEEEDDEDEEGIIEDEGDDKNDNLVDT